MANPLQRGNVPPPAPDMALSQPQSAQGPGPAAAPQQQAPAPTHGQAVAGLRHFNAFLNELDTLARDPKLGKSDARKDIIEGVTKLVAGGFLTADKAVAELGTVPERPFDQKMWVNTHIQKFMASATAMLDHHRAAFPGTQDAGIEGAAVGNPDTHANDMSGLLAHYQQQQG